MNFDRESRMLLELGLRTMGATDAQVFRCRHGVGTGKCTLKAAGLRVGLSPERVRQRQIRAERLMMRFLEPKEGR